LTRITGTLYEGLCTVMIESRWILVGMGNILGKICTQNQNTHFIFNKFSSKERVFDEIIWEEKQKALLFFHCSNCYANALQCYVIHTYIHCLSFYYVSAV